jgi:hypothetical protein
MVYDAENFFCNALFLVVVVVVVVVEIAVNEISH